MAVEWFDEGIKIVAYARRRRAAPEKVQDFADSISPDIEVHMNDRPVKCDLAIIWGMYNLKVEEMQRKNGKPFLLLEYGYYGNHQEYTSINYNGMHGCGTRPPPGEKTRPKPTIWPWRNEKGTVLLCGHVPDDPLCRNGPTDKEWYADVIPRIRREYPGRSIRFRLHPRTGDNIPKGVDEYHNAKDVSLEEAVQGVEVAYNYGSTVDVKLTCLGVPCISESRISMVGNHAAPWDRTEWAHWISYCRWNREELRDGTAAKHISKGYMDARRAAEMGVRCQTCVSRPEDDFMPCPQSC